VQIKHSAVCIKIKAKFHKEQWWL